jgi:ribonuclease T2
MGMNRCAALLIGLLAAAAVASAQDFSYYLLSLSYAPGFCDQPNAHKNARECDGNNGFVVHGLWPQGDSGRGPEGCGAARPVSGDIVRQMLNYIPTESLIQHEWATHGTCSGLSPADYFALVRKARDAVKIPGDLSRPQREIDLSPAQIESEMAAANPSFPRGAFRVACYRNNELQEIRICFNKDLSPRDCGGSAGQCRASAVILKPIR